VNPFTKNLLGIVLFLAVGTGLFAQLRTLPPSAITDGVVVNRLGLNSGVSHWESAESLGMFRVAADCTAPLAELGAYFSSTPPPSLLAERNRINGTGGTIRAIFLGESAGWLNDFGYSYDGQPASASSYTVYRDIQALSGTNQPVNVAFGNSIDLALGVGSAGQFDFWLNAVGNSGSSNDGVAGASGGVYTVFDPSGSSPYIPPGNVRYLQEPLMVNTWVPALERYVDVATYVVGFEDSRLDNPIDGDYSDLIMGFQFYILDAWPLDQKTGSASVPIPEPSTYSCLAAVGLLALLTRRSLARVC